MPIGIRQQVHHDLPDSHLVGVHLDVGRDVEFQSRVAFQRGCAYRGMKQRRDRDTHALEPNLARFCVCQILQVVDETTEVDQVVLQRGQRRR